MSKDEEYEVICTSDMSEDEFDLFKKTFKLDLSGPCFIKLDQERYFNVKLRRDSNPGTYKILVNFEYSDQCLKDLELCQDMYLEKAEKALNMWNRKDTILDLFNDGGLDLDKRTANPAFLSHKHILRKNLCNEQIELIGLYADIELTHFLDLICQEVEKCCKMNPENKNKKITNYIKNPIKNRN